jgi:hypothetical protein
MKKSLNAKFFRSFIFLSIIFISSLFLGLEQAHGFEAVQEPVEGEYPSNYTGSGTIYLKMWAVVCNSESDLPNLNIPHSSYVPNTDWQKDTGGLVITESYITNWVATHPNCKFADGWTFRYGKGEGFPSYTSDPKWPGWITTNPTSGGVTIAYIPGTTLGDKWIEDWNTPWAPDFTVYEQRVYVSMLRGPGTYSLQWKYDVGGYVPDEYVDFSTYNNPPSPYTHSPVSTELHCYDNHIGYDNYEYVRTPSGGQTYNCVLFTAYRNPATIKVDSSQCSVANWYITPGGFSGSGGNGGTYTGAPGTYTMASVGVPAGYTYEVTNSDDSTSSMNVPAGQTKTFYIKCTPPQAKDPKINLTVNGVKNVEINANESATLSWTTENVVANGCRVSGGWSGTRDRSGSESTGSLTQSTNYGITCSNIDGKEASDSVSVTVKGTPPVELPPCRVDSFNDQWENNGWVYPTWSTSLSNNVVLSGGQFGSGVSVEPDGQRSININSDTTLTITANAGESCYPSVSKSAVMHAEAEAACTVPGKEYLKASDPNCKYDVASCSFVNPYNGGDGFDDFLESGDGYVNINWYSNADTLTLSGGPWSNTPVTAPNGGITFWNVTANTILTLSGNGGLCTNTSTVYAAPAPPKPSPFTATASSCGTRKIDLSWGEAPGSYNYVVFRNGQQIYSGPEWNPYGWTVTSDTGLTPGITYSYSVIGQSPNGNTEPNTASAIAPADCPTPPSVLLNVNPQNVPYNGTTNITWSTVGADSCVASGGWSGSRATQSPSAGESSAGLTTNTTFTLTCNGSGGSGSDTKTVTVGTQDLPDLTAYAPSTDRATVGTELFFSASTLNIGAGSTNGSFYNFFQLADAADGGGEISPLQPVLMQTLEPNTGRQTNSPNYTFTAPGVYSIRMCVDKKSSIDAGLITESNENNNCSGWTNVTVDPGAPAFDYTLTRDSGALSVTQGNPVSNTIYKHLVSGTGSAVDLDVSGLPAGSGISISYANRTCTPDPDCSSSITFQASALAPVDTYNITVTGSPLNKTTAFTLKVNPTSALSVTCSASQEVGGNKINKPVTWTANATGGSGTYNSWSWSGTNIPTSPAPTSNPYTISYSTTGTKTARATVTDSNGNQATCPDATTIINFDPTIIEF